jgi:hypothetical protein
MSSVLSSMAALSLLKQKPAPRRIARRKATIAPNRGNKVHREVGHEFLSFLTVPAATTFGNQLYSLEVNPTQFPRLGVFASQFKQWKGDVKLHVESLGNAFANSSVSLAYVPDPDPTDLPADPTALLRVINASPSQANLHLQAQGTKSVVASWKLSTNPWKFVVDSQPSDRANGLFLVVANGSPGASDIPLKVSVSYDVQFQGNTFAPLEGALANVAQAVYGVNNNLSDTLFQPTTGATNYTISGSGNVNLNLNYPIGSVSQKYYGIWTGALGGLPFGAIVTGFAYGPASTAANITRSSLVGLTISATQTVYTFSSAFNVTGLTGALSFAVLPRTVTQ